MRGYLGIVETVYSHLMTLRFEIRFERDTHLIMFPINAASLNVIAGPSRRRDDKFVYDVTDAEKFVCPSTGQTDVEQAISEPH